MKKKKRISERHKRGESSTNAVLHINPTVVPARPDNNKFYAELYEYSPESFSSKILDSINDLRPHPGGTTITWLNISGLSNSEIENLSAAFGIHQLITEDILSIGQRPKMDEINGLVFCLLNMLYFNDETSEVEPEQISVVLGTNFVITFQEEGKRDVFSALREKIKVTGSKIRQNKADFLFYSLIDAIVDHYFVTMEKLGDKIEDLEEEIIHFSDKESLSKINNLRKEMIVLKRNISPVRELVGGIMRSDSEIIQDRTEKYFKDVYDHIIQANDLSENYRDMMMNLQDLYLSNVNLKLNEVMKVIAIVTSLMAPATVIGGIFGMNFDKIPLLHNQWGFYISVAVMLLVPVGMVMIFKKRGWF